MPLPFVYPLLQSFFLHRVLLYEVDSYDRGKRMVPISKPSVLHRMNPAEERLMVRKVDTAQEADRQRQRHEGRAEIAQRVEEAELFLALRHGHEGDFYRGRARAWSSSTRTFLPMGVEATAPWRFWSRDGFAVKTDNHITVTMPA